MADTYTARLRLIQMVTGSNDRAWGTKADTTFAMIDQAIAGQENVSVTAGNVTLTTADNADDQARNAVLSFTGTPGVTRTVTFPDVEKTTLAINSSDSYVTLTSGAGLTASLAPGQVAIVLTDGATNLYAFIIQDAPGHGVLPQVFATEAL